MLQAWLRHAHTNPGALQQQSVLSWQAVIPHAATHVQLHQNPMCCLVPVLVAQSCQTSVCSRMLCGIGRQLRPWSTLPVGAQWSAYAEDLQRLLVNCHAACCH